MSVRKSFSKTVVERRRLYISYDCWLPELEKLTDFSVLVSPFTADAPLVVDVAFTDVNHRKLAFFSSGGKGNTQYVIQLIVRTDGGQTKRDDIGLAVKP
ncbi:MAG TPA: hypothetical protein VMS92_18995 [Mycobacterium sp.]|nr:hypothetical protein [Mycobacterium sp.]